ncbi:MAG: hypothetical protein ABI565_13825 [Vicinamibacteria bacterium]
MVMDSAASIPEPERRRRRATWPVRRFPLGEEPGDDLSATTTAEERLAMMRPLAEDAFSRSASELIPRSQWPVRIRRLGDPGVD